MLGLVPHFPLIFCLSVFLLPLSSGCSPLQILLSVFLFLVPGVELRASRSPGPGFFVPLASSGPGARSKSLYRTVLGVDTVG